jgi:hypothetical protein
MSVSHPPKLYDDFKQTDTSGKIDCQGAVLAGLRTNHSVDIAMFVTTLATQRTCMSSDCPFVSLRYWHHSGTRSPESQAWRLPMCLRDFCETSVPQIHTCELTLQRIPPASGVVEYQLHKSTNFHFQRDHRSSDHVVGVRIPPAAPNHSTHVCQVRTRGRSEPAPHPSSRARIVTRSSTGQ